MNAINIDKMRIRRSEVVIIKPENAQYKYKNVKRRPSGKVDEQGNVIRDYRLGSYVYGDGQFVPYLDYLLTKQVPLYSRSVYKFNNGQIASKSCLKWDNICNMLYIHRLGRDEDIIKSANVFKEDIAKNLLIKKYKLFKKAKNC